MKKLLYTRESIELQPLLRLIEKQSHRVLVLWAIDCADSILELFEERYPQDTRPREAVVASRLWAEGKIKMTIAKKAALTAHKAANEVSDDIVACSAARAMGHVVGTVHVETHAIGLVMYGLTGIAYQAISNGDNLQRIVDGKVNWFYERLLYWQENWNNEPREWAAFLVKNKPNKEKLLREKLMKQNTMKNK